LKKDGTAFVIYIINNIMYLVDPLILFANLENLINMGIKHLLGFFLIMSGIGAGSLILFFIFNNQFYTQLFLSGVGIFAFLSFIAGIFILTKSH